MLALLQNRTFKSLNRGTTGNSIIDSTFQAVLARSLLFIATLLLVILLPISFSHSEPSTPDDACVAKACTQSIKLLAPISITGRTIACAKETLDIIFNQSSECKSMMLVGLKRYVKGGVYVALTLAVILLGMKITLSGEVPKTSELFNFILKFGVVLYMCIGTGLTELVYKGGTALITDLPNYLMSQSNDKFKFCDYESRDYGDNGKYAYVLAWDILDCRISHYLLIGLAGAPALSGLMPFGALQIIIPLVFSLQIVISILLLVFAIFILSLAANFLHMMVIAMLSLGILTYAGFIFVPLMLFSYTEGYFKKWWQSLVSCALQPVIISAFMSVTFLAFDDIMYKGCEFEEKKDPGNPDKIVWAIKASSLTECQQRLGYQLFTLLTSRGITGEEVGLVFQYSIFKPNFRQIGDLLQALIKALFFCYLFMLIARKGGDFASQLTSGPKIGSVAVSAGALIDALKDKLGTKPKEGDKKDSGSQASQSTGSGSTASTGKGGSQTGSKASRK